MKKEFFSVLLVSLLALSISTARAQSDTTTFSSVSDTVEVVTLDTEGIVIVNKDFWHNWFVTAGVGAQIYLGENDRFGSLSGTVSPLLEIGFGKWFAPGFGIQLGYSGYESRGYIRADHENQTTAYGDPFTASNGLEMRKQKWTYSHFRADAMVNLTNVIWGYKENRTYSLIPYFGLGMITTPDWENSTEITGTLGIKNLFRVTDGLSLYLDLKTTLIHDRFDTEPSPVINGNKFFEGIAAVSIGFTYNFKSRGWKRPTNTRQRITTTNTYNTVRTAPPVKAPVAPVVVPVEPPAPVVVPVIEKEIVLVSPPIFFDLNSTELLNRSRVHLQFIAEAMKSLPKDRVFTIIGSADKQTGNDRINHYLSKGRAERVYKALVEEFGIEPERLKIEYRGGVDYMFYNDNTLSRAVIIK